MKIRFRKKSENNTNKPIIIQYNPPEGLDSAEVGLLFYGKSDPISLISLIYKRLLSGFISIDKQNTQKTDNKKSSYIIHKNKDLPESTPSYEALFWKSVFDSGEDTEINDKTNLYLDASLKELEERGYKKGWFIKNNGIDKEASVMMGIIIALMILLFVTPNNTGKEEIMTIILLIIFFIIFTFPRLGIIVGIGIPKFKKMKKSEKGNDLIYHILGFKKFLETCDTKILETFLKKDPSYFDKILPYAIIFGIETELIEKFRPLVDEFELNLYIYHFNNHLYGIMHNSIIENSTPRKTRKIPNTEGNNSYDPDIGFSKGSSFSKKGSNFSKGGGGGGGGGKSW